MQIEITTQTLINYLIEGGCAGSRSKKRLPKRFKTPHSVKADQG